MSLIDSKQKEYMELTESAFSDVFGGNMKPVSRQASPGHMGHFLLRYRYLPLSYDVVFENDRGRFSVDIFDGEGAKNTLYRIHRFPNRTTPENIANAVSLLLEVLNKNDFCFYVSRDGKTYWKKDGQYRRIRDLNELLNGAGSQN